MGMNEGYSKWLTEELADIFSEGVRGAIRGANLQLEIITKLISAWRPLPSRILDLGCGDGILGRMLLAQHPSAHTAFSTVVVSSLISIKLVPKLRP
jgi:tRNA (cmo5U34)-methyltransferase